jgi:hypothetical protein
VLRQGARLVFFVDYFSEQGRLWKKYRNFVKMPEGQRK